VLERIAPTQAELRLVYLSNWTPILENLSYKNNNLNSVHFTGQGHLPSLELLEQAFWTQTKILESAEQKAGHSLVGPHRDDWCFLLGGQALKGHGSQGEVRSALLALKLAEIILFRKKTGHRPIFLLDDFSSELDRDRRWFLLDYLRETDLQTFVTTTEDSTYVGKRYWVNQGTIEEGRHDDRTEAV
jgi:recombinational DNA repair ATPase RecF